MRADAAEAMLGAANRPANRGLQLQLASREHAVDLVDHGTDGMRLRRWTAISLVPSNDANKAPKDQSRDNSLRTLSGEEEPSLFLLGKRDGACSGWSRRVEPLDDGEVAGGEAGYPGQRGDQRTAPRRVAVRIIEQLAVRIVVDEPVVSVASESCSVDDEL